MKIVGIVAEYNPFHLGHRYHIQKSKEETGADCVIAVMSGNLVQRGDMAVTDKFIRAEEAIKNGADLVLEIPVCYSCQSAEIFARGSIEILDSLGVVDFLAFGSESANIDLISDVAAILSDEDEEFQKNLKLFLSKGMSFPLARQRALSQSIEQNHADEIISASNDILAIEYLKNLKLMKSDIKAFAIKRISSTYNDENINAAFPSATAIRKVLKEKNNTQEDVSDLNKLMKKSTTRDMAKMLTQSFSQDNLISFDDFYEDLKTVILREESKIEKYFEVNEGIENLILKNILTCHTLEDLIEKVKSKRYTRTRIRRILLNILIGITKSDMHRILGKSQEYAERDLYSRPYTRVLAFNDKGRSLLKQINESVKNEKIDIINKAASFKASSELQEIKLRYDRIANNMYYSKYRAYKKEVRAGSDMLMSPVYIKNK